MNGQLTGQNKVEIALNSQTISTSTTTVGNVIDRQGFSDINFVITTGTRTDGTYTPAITECDTSGGSYTAVDDADLIKKDESSATTPEAQAALAATNGISKIGYKGIKRFVKLTIVSTAVTSGCTSVHAIVEKEAQTQPTV